MCEISKSQRRTFRDQDPPRISNRSTENLLKDETELSRSTPNSPTTIIQRASTFEKCFSEPDFLDKKKPTSRKIRRDTSTSGGSTSRSPSRVSRRNSRERNANGRQEFPENGRRDDDFLGELSAKVPSSPCKRSSEIITNGLKRDSDICDGLTNGREMAPVLGVPPPPPPAPHMGPDGLILPRKPYNPCLTSTNHKDLHRELLFNQKIGKNVLNQKSELQRALEKQREAASRREAERIREESYKDDPRTALQRAIEQRAKQMQSVHEQTQQDAYTPNNLLITARAKLRPRTESQ